MGKKLKKLLKHLLVPHRGNAYRPHALRHKALSIYSLGLVATQLLFGATMYAGPTIMEQDIRALKENIVVLSNTERTKNELEPLRDNKTLNSAAEAKLSDMFAKNYWDHTGPNGETAWDFISADGYQYLLAGENLARGFASSKEVVSAWMASPTHRANILNPRFKEVGLAIGTGKINGKQTTVIVQIFGEPQTAFAGARSENQILGEKKLIPEISLSNATAPAKIPYLLMWIVIFGFVVIDGIMIRRLGLHASRSHIFNMRASLLMAAIALATITFGFVGIA